MADQFQALEELEKALRERDRKMSSDTLRIPRLWTAPWTDNGEVTIERASLHCANFIRSIRESSTPPSERAKSLLDRFLYCLLPRFSSAYRQQGPHSTQISSDWKSSGTFLKCLLMLPYLRSLGIDTIYLLPINRIGRVPRKGNAGSLYAIRDLLALDDSLSEDQLECSIDIQYAAFVEAAHALGMSVLMEFTLRTASRDCDWVQEHPEWFYWVYEQGNEDTLISPPHFSDSDLETIHHKVENQDFRHLPQPSEEYKRLFAAIPLSLTKDEFGMWVGFDAEGRRCRIASAFADYPPNDTQPPWSDVTYFRMYQHPDFNYVAYNTIRMYDEVLRQEGSATSELWDRLSSILPMYCERYGIDGAVLDMSHALPHELRDQIIRKVREIKSDFILIEENFFMRKSSRDLGFDAVLGNAWQHSSSVAKFSALRDQRSEADTEIAYIASPDTHNTPRAAAQVDASELCSILSIAHEFRNGVPMLLSGTELGEKRPINTGLGFCEEDLNRYSEYDLALFSTCWLNWKDAPTNYLDCIRAARQQHLKSKV